MGASSLRASMTLQELCSTMPSSHLVTAVSLPVTAWGREGGSWHQISTSTVFSVQVKFCPGFHYLLQVYFAPHLEQTGESGPSVSALKGTVIWEKSSSMHLTD